MERIATLIDFFEVPRRGGLIAVSKLTRAQLAEILLAQLDALTGRRTLRPPGSCILNSKLEQMFQTYHAKYGRILITNKKQ